MMEVAEKMCTWKAELTPRNRPLDFGELYTICQNPETVPALAQGSNNQEIDGESRLPACLDTRRWRKQCGRPDK